MQKFAIPIFLISLSHVLRDSGAAPLYHHSDHQFNDSKQLLTSSSHHQYPQWSYFDSEKQMCNHEIYYAVQFFENRTHLRVGYCATYDEALEIVSFSPCPYFQSKGFVVRETKSNIWYIQLPDNISELNDYMCGPLNRKGEVCSECMDGFGPAVTSVGFQIQCANCTGVWYGVPLYLFLEFVPVTIFFLIILIFDINITSAPMTCYILYSQLIPLWWSFAFNGEDLNVSRRMFILNNESELFRKIILTIYDVWNLQFFHALVPPFCISSSLKPFHAALFGYISIFYPIFLIVFTWICISLHNNFPLIVWLWKPFQRCFHYLRKRWIGKDNGHIDITNVFVSFFLLSFSKVLYQTDLFWSFQTIRDIDYNNLGNLIDKKWKTNIDLTVPYGSTEHLLAAIPAILVCCVFNILPALLLLLYPIKGFGVCLSKCNTRFQNRLRHFVEKFYGCYRTHAEDDGGKDMRSFAALYFIIRPMIFMVSTILSVFYISNNDPYLSRNAVFVVASLLIALCRPYKKMYMNVLDSLLLAYFGLFCHLVSSYPGFQYPAPFVITFEIMLVLPFIGFLLFVSLRIVQKARESCCNNVRAFSRLSFQKFKSCCSSCYRQSSDTEHLLSDPTSTVTYGIVSIETE